MSDSQAQAVATILLDLGPTPDNVNVRAIIHALNKAYQAGFCAGFAGRDKQQEILSDVIERISRGRIGT